MRNIYIGVIASVLIAAPSVAIAEKSVEEAATETKKAAETKNVAEIKKAADDNKMRCKRIQVTGSLIKKRLCRTNAEWAEMASSGNRQARGMVDHANQGVTSGR